MGSSLSTGKGRCGSLRDCGQVAASAAQVSREGDVLQVRFLERVNCKPRRPGQAGMPSGFCHLR